MKKRTVGAVVIAVAVLATGGGWWAGTAITSPAEVAARTAAPQASPILVPVEARVLTSDVVTRGTGRFGSPQKLTIAASSLKPNVGVVSDVAIAGTTLQEGTVALNASGRPLFVLMGADPLSRDLGPGMTGDDVGQLEASLARLGFDPGPSDGVYDGATEAAVTALYVQSGFSAFSATADQLTVVRARETELAKSLNESLTAAANVDAASTAVIAAQAALDEATSRAVNAPSAVLRARSHADSQNRAADAEVAAARQALALRKAMADPPATAEELAVADRDLVLALTAAESTRLTADREVAEAETAAATAARDVLTQTALLESSRSSHRNAQATLVSHRGIANLAQDEADLAHRQAGVQVPADEVVFVASVPARISEVLVGKGDLAVGVALIVTDTVVSVDAGLALGDVALIESGMAVHIEEPDLGIEADGVVKAIAAGPGTNGVDGFHVYFETSVAAAPVNLVGASVRLTIAVESTVGTTLAVPISALSLAPDRTSRVQRHRDGVVEFVTVVPGLSAEGYVAVTGDIAEGDLVSVGIDQPIEPTTASGG